MCMTDLYHHQVLLSDKQRKSIDVYQSSFNTPSILSLIAISDSFSLVQCPGSNLSFGHYTRYYFFTFTVILILSWGERNYCKSALHASFLRKPGRPCCTNPQSVCSNWFSLKPRTSHRFVSATQT